MINKIFESDKYSLIMFILISAVLLLLLFNFVGILNKADNNNFKRISGSGFAVREIKNITDNQTATNEEKIYSEKSYGFYYLIITGVVVMILFLSVALILPRVKEYI